MQITWQTCPDVSLWYALAARAAGRALVDDRLAAELEELLRRSSPLVRSTEDAADVDRQVDFWQRACLQAARGDSSSRPPGWSRSAQELAECLASARELFSRHLPRLASELPLRVRPFYELWEARGPGLLRQMFRHAGQEEPTPACLVSWVHPACGGGGWSDAATRTVFLEAVLVNPFAPLPEVLRLAWLIAHAFLTTRRSLGSFAEQGRERVESLALVPAVLAAGEYVALTVCDARQVSAALTAWLAISEPRAAELGTTLAAWWEETAESRLSWPEALARLGG